MPRETIPGPKASKVVIPRPSVQTIPAAVTVDGNDIVIPLGSVCIPISTQRVENEIMNYNDDPNSLGPITIEGFQGNCLDLEGSVTAGISLVGQVNFFDSIIGDINAQTFFSCQ